MRREIKAAVDSAAAATPDALAAAQEAIFATLAEAEATRAEADQAFSALKAAVPGVTLGSLRTDFKDYLRANNLVDEQRSVGTILVQLATKNGIELWHTPDARAYATIPIDGHLEHRPVRSLREYLGKLHYDETGHVAHSQGINDAVGTLEGRALYDGEQHEAHLRVAEHDGAIYIDLSNDAWEAVKITAAGWSVVQSADLPVRFRRSSGTLPLPTPDRDGDLTALAVLLNLGEGSEGSDSRSWILLVTWLLQSLRAAGGYPIANLTGPQGSGKTTVSRILRQLVDPNVSPVRTLSRDEDALMVAANASHVLAFDNASNLRLWISDALCRLATGGGLSKRAHYSNYDEIILDAKKPIILNGIEDVVVQQDLADRTVQIQLPPIVASERLTEAELWARFEAVHARILGALFDVAAGGLARLPEVRLEQKPRMADYALWATACEEPLGLAPGAFMRAYDLSKADLVAAALEGEPIVEHILALAEDGVVELPAGKLRSALLVSADLEEGKRLPEGWPKSARALTGKLQRLAPILEAVHGLRLSRPESRTACGRPWRVEIIQEAPSQHSQPSQSSEEARQGRDTGGDAQSEGLGSSEGRTFTPDETVTPTITANSASGAQESAPSDGSERSEGELLGPSSVLLGENHVKGLRLAALRGELDMVAGFNANGIRVSSLGPYIAQKSLDQLCEIGETLYRRNPDLERYRGA